MAAGPGMHPSGTQHRLLRRDHSTPPDIVLSGHQRAVCPQRPRESALSSAAGHDALSAHDALPPAGAEAPLDPDLHSAVNTSLKCNVIRKI